jgi:dipeptidyl aminopeptidase/acylaminoacyl peptidase
VARQGPPRRDAAVPLKTRDGLEIPSYYFLPRNYKPGDKLPTVVHVHGGPHVRADTWARGFGYMEAEILASHGYAVILPNFRVTPGLRRQDLQGRHGRDRPADVGGP